MASNHFFSGRIPNGLYEQAEKHCEETGDSKTEVLIKALSAYLNFPIAIPEKNIITTIPEVTKEMFETLEERVKALEESLKTSISNVIKADNIDNDNESIKEIVIDNTLEIIDNQIDNIEPGKNKEYPLITDNAIENSDDNTPLQTSIVESEISCLPNFLSIETAKVIELTGLTQSQINGFRDRILDNYQKQGNIIIRKQLLENPIVIDYKKPINVNNDPYTLIYLGQNSKGKALWNLMPDNNSYQPMITELNYKDKRDNNSSYQINNNATPPEDSD